MGDLSPVVNGGYVHLRDFVQVGDTAPMSGMGIDREQLRALVNESDRSARKISLDAGLGATAVKDILSGKSKRPEYDTLAAIARELHVEVTAFTKAVDETERPRADQNRVEPRFLLVRYKVQAGLWEEVEFAEPPVQVSLPVLPDPRYGNLPQWLELVQGDSVNMKIPSGHYAHVVDAIEMGYAPKDGDWVVVERRTEQGGKRERTIKQIEVAGTGVIRLRTRSTNPKWEKHAPLVFRNGVAVVDGRPSASQGDLIEVAIVGLVIGSYNPDF